MELMKIGEEYFWDNKEIGEVLPEFLALYEERPIRDNQGGMGIPHLFASWFILKKLQPKVIVESGVWLGQGTWFFEQVCPGAKLFCIEPEYDRIQYVSPKATYYQKDFSQIYWGNLPKEDTLLFFDDHQNALERVKWAEEYGFRHVVFEDNYPAQRGDCYSLKKAFAEVGYSPNPYQEELKRVLPNKQDGDYLKRVLEVYFEFPPIVRTKKTRWGDNWKENYPTPPSLFNENDDYQMPPQEYRSGGFKIYTEEDGKPDIFDISPEEFLEYTWICYIKLKEKEYHNA